MADLLRIYIPYREGAVNQDMWLHNIDKLAIFIDWGDGSPIQATGDTNNEYISHSYTTIGSYNIYAYSEDVWGTDTNNAIITTQDSKMILIHAQDITINDAFEIRNYISFPDNVLNSAFLNLMLPNTAIEVGSNEFAIANNINDVFIKLYQNTNYLLEQTTVIDPTINDTLVSWLSAGQNNYVWNPAITGLDTYFNVLTAPSNFINIIDIKARKFNNTSFIYIIDNNTFKLLNGMSYFATQFIQTSSIGFNQPFNNLYAVDVDSTNDIFLLDVNTVYKTRYDNINNQIILQTQIGGTGSLVDRYLFNNAIDLVVDNFDRVIVIDSNNLCFKVYTKNLVWTNTIGLQFYTNSKPIKICTNKASKKLYILTNNLDLLVFDQNFNFILKSNLLLASNSVNLFGILQSDTVYKLFSDNQDNYLYVVTGSSVIKLTKNGRLISKFSDPKSSILIGLRSGCFDSHNQILIAKFNRIFQILNPIVSISLKGDTVPLISLSAITVNTTGHEFIQDWVYNKSLKKILRNLIILNGSLQEKVVISFDLDGSLRSFFIRTLDFDEKHFIPVTLDNFINVNEFVLSDTVNRVLGNIVDNQKQMLAIIKPEVVFIPGAIQYPVLP